MGLSSTVEARAYFPDPELAELHREILRLAFRHWDAKWGPTERYQRWNVRQLLWEAASPTTPNRADFEKAAAAFVQRAVAKLSKYTIVVSLAGAHGISDIVALEGVSVGSLDKLAPKSDMQRVAGHLGRLDPLWARADVEAPNEKLAIASARDLVDQALDFLSSADLRLRVDRGEPSKMEVGEDFGFVAPDGTIKFWISRDWLSPEEYALSPETLADKASFRAEQGPFPWLKIANGSELKNKVREAYRRFGRARRLSRDPEAALPLALSSLEFLLGNERGDKRHPTAARLLLCAVNLNRATALPIDVVNWFIYRNEIIHEGMSGQATRWERIDAMNSLLGIYDFLDLAADFAVKSGAKTKKDMIQKLLDPTAIQNAEKWVDEWIKELNAEKGRSHSPSFASTIQEDIDRWTSIRRFLTSPYDG